jgi:hydrogenase maturation protein HypF
VGFRPFVHRLAVRHGLAGWVRNTSGRVVVHVEGDPGSIDEFAASLGAEAPVLARIERISRDLVIAEGLSGFVVSPSTADASERQPVSPDVATCDACLRELADPSNRRFRYPFITCTDCGPRFTVIESMPYDRERTSMRVFQQCPECLAEYGSPYDRRYHSETNSCPTCGPRLWFAWSREESGPASDDALASAIGLLRSGGILALRGLGGYHLAVDATSEEAVRRLRDRKHRDSKPLAVMVKDIGDAHRLGAIDEEERRLLESPARPIVLIRCEMGDGRNEIARDRTALADGIAPGLAHVGVMLAYTPLHHLLLEAMDRPLVMTSGNMSDEPIATSNDEAFDRLSGIADGFLLHDREIVARYDDSVLRVVDRAPVFLRRARGFAPLPIEVPVASPLPLLAVGPHLKNTFTLLQDGQAYVSQHIGDLENIETVEHFLASRRRLEALFNIRPEVVVHDLHPGYLSTRLALESGLRVLPAVQHHHAHIAAVMAEHGRVDPVIGVAYDGTGYGHDGAIWGAEILFANLTRYRRLAHLRYAPLPGGDAAARAPWRSAAGYLSAVPEAAEALRRATTGIPDGLVQLVRRQLERGVNSPPASSLGRLFDAAAAVLGVRRISRFEGDAAMALEALAADVPGSVLPFCITSRDGGIHELDPVPALVMLGERAAAGESVAMLAASFHDTVVHATAELVRHVHEDTGCRTVALGGGCFQNARLLSGLRSRLERDGYEVLVPSRLSPNDGAISLGQAAIAAARLADAPNAADVLINAKGG